MHYMVEVEKRVFRYTYSLNVHVNSKTKQAKTAYTEDRRKLTFYCLTRYRTSVVKEITFPNMIGLFTTCGFSVTPLVGHLKSGDPLPVLSPGVTGYEKKVQGTDSDLRVG